MLSIDIYPFALERDYFTLRDYVESYGAIVESINFLRIIELYI